MRAHGIQKLASQNSASAGTASTRSLPLTAAVATIVVTIPVSAGVTDAVIAAEVGHTDVRVLVLSSEIFSSF